MFAFYSQVEKKTGFCVEDIIAIIKAQKESIAASHDKTALGYINEADAFLQIIVRNSYLKSQLNQNCSGVNFKKGEDFDLFNQKLLALFNQKNSNNKSSILDDFEYYISKKSSRVNCNFRTAFNIYMIILGVLEVIIPYSPFCLVVGPIFMLAGAVGLYMNVAENNWYNQCLVDLHALQDVWSKLEPLMTDELAQNDASVIGLRCA